MKKIFYPAIFYTAEEGGYWITFPDFDWCATQGRDTEEAYAMGVNFSQVLQEALLQKIRLK